MTGKLHDTGKALSALIQTLNKTCTKQTQTIYIKCAIPEYASTQ